MAKKKKPKELDPYAPVQNIRISLPLPFMHLCKLLQVEPVKIINGLLLDIGSAINLSNGLTQQRATDYFLSQKYGQELFTEGQLRQMLAELGVIRGLHPSYDVEDIKAVDRWRDLMGDYFKVWETKWQAKKKGPSVVSNK
jgi:hypothetical protein